MKNKFKKGNTSGFKKGHTPWNKGMLGFNKGHKPTYVAVGDKNPSKRPEVKEKIRLSKIGQIVSKEWRDKIRKTLKGRKLSFKHCKNIAISHRGNKSHFWRGGATPLLRIIRNSFKYRQWVSDIFYRDNFTCQKCGIRGCYLEAHHIKEFVKIIREYKIKTLEQALECEELWNINNGKTLCKNCHNKTKKGVKTLG